MLRTMEKYERQYIKDRRIEDLVKEFASGFFQLNKY